MKISKSWLNEWIDINDKSTDEICVALNDIGLEVDACIHLNINKGIVVAKILECKTHENSNHLHICSVDCGRYGVFQIVCGAKNVQKDQFVACALIGTQVGDIIIKKANLRGVESSGMLCSAKELGLGNLNDGIMILDESIGKLELGKELREYNIFNDDIIEIELTPNRGDCLSILGVARDLSAKLNISLKDLTLNEKKPEEEAFGIGRLFSLHNSHENKSSSLFYKAVDLSADFHLNLKELLRLSLIDIKPNSALEGALSYTTHNCGVLFCAYDARKISSDPEIKISFKTQCQSNNEVKIYANDKLLSIVGIWQNKEFIADKFTQTAIIEAHYTEPIVIANIISNNKNLQKDEVTYRSSRGSEPNLQLGINLLTSHFLSQEGLYNGNQQIDNKKDGNEILINYSHLYNIIGEQIDEKEIYTILTKLNFDIATGDRTDKKFYVKAPAYRHDIKNIQDICEEIIRIKGINNIQSTPLQFSENNRLTPAYIKHKNAGILRQKAAQIGYFECVHYIFDNAQELKALGFKECELKLVNPITNELSELKPTLINALLNSAINNAKNGKKQIKLFEYGEVFTQNGKQNSKIAFLQSGLFAQPSLLNGAKGVEVSFFTFASDLQKILGQIELKQSNKISFLSPFEQAEILQDNKIIGFLGRVKPTIKEDLPKTYICEIDFDKIDFKPKIAKKYSIYPAISRDLSLLINKNISYEKIKLCIENLKISELRNFYPIDIYTDDKLKDSISLTITFIFQSDTKTFVDDEINNFINTIIQALKDDLGINLR